MVNEAGTPAADATALAARALAVFALVAALYLARAFFVPLLIGILASYALHPLVDWLERRRMPRSIGAALMLAIMLGSLSWIGYSLSGDAQALIQKLPRAAHKLRKHLSAARTSAPTALQNVQEAAQRAAGGRGRCRQQTERAPVRNQCA